MNRFINLLVALAVPKQQRYEMQSAEQSFEEAHRQFENEYTSKIEHVSTDVLREVKKPIRKSANG